MDSSALEAYRTPRDLKGVPQSMNESGRLGKTFRDDTDLASASDLTAVIVNALDASDWLIVVCSPATPASRWVTEEIKEFLKRRSRDRIILVLVAGDPDQSLPHLLRDMSNGEILAADMRPTANRNAKAARQHGFLQIVARMLCVDFDALVSREALRVARKRQRQLAVAASIVLTIGALGTLYLSERIRAEASTALSLFSKGQDFETRRLNAQAGLYYASALQTTSIPN
jgi:hypothetical protein